LDVGLCEVKLKQGVKVFWWSLNFIERRIMELLTWL